ncbi:MAG: spoIIAB [Clostridia bacterium]|jgi:stage II sporulation protein AB (anti-sigma F factor)|nr:spoIIAB [Clostridia bacterium]
MENNMKIEIDSNTLNISVVRVAVATFVSTLDISIDDLMDIKTAVSEAVTNSIEHGYENSKGKVIIEAKITEGVEDIVAIIVKDYGIGISDIELATTPTYTSKPELEHAGLGFTIMESFMDQIEIDSSVNNGTTIKLIKILKKKKSI